MSQDYEDKLDELLLLVRETLTVKKEDKEYREKHAEEHRFLRALIEERQASTAFKRAIAQKVISGGVWAIVVGIVGAILFTVKAWLTGKIV